METKQESEVDANIAQSLLAPATPAKIFWLAFFLLG